jgi:hypothetical protein
MVTEKLISAINEVHLHDGIIADGRRTPERVRATDATVGNEGRRRTG